MRLNAQSIVAGAIKLHAPLILLFAATLLSARAPGTGVGLLAGLGCALALTLYGLVLGASAFRVAFPGAAMRVLLGIGLALSLFRAGAPRALFAAQSGEAGLALCVAAASALIIAVLFGRAPTMRDGEW